MKLSKLGLTSIILTCTVAIMLFIGLATYRVLDSQPVIQQHQHINLSDRIEQVSGSVVHVVNETQEI
jgi:hypothetical protein